MSSNNVFLTFKCDLLQRSTVYRILKQQEEEGHVNPKPIPGRNRSTTVEEDHNISEFIRRSGFNTAQQCLVELDLQISLPTIRRRWNNIGYHHQIPAEKELLTVQHKEQRMAFALDHIVWNNEWECTIFSDEKVFSTDESGRVTLWRTRGSRYAEENIHFRQRCGRITLGFWGCMSSHGPGPLARITPHMNSEEYINILSDVMMPYIAETFPGVPYVNFVQDNSGVHRARVVQDWLAAQPNLNTLNWPAKSPDLNVIENLWGIITQEWDPQIQRTREALAQYVVNKWEGLRARPALFQNLIESMPRRLNAVIENNGSATRY